MIRVLIPTPLRSHTQGRKEVEVSAAEVGGALHALVQQHPGLRAQLFDEDGRLRRFVNLFLDDEDVRMHAGLDTPLEGRRVLEILPAVAGGSGLSLAEWRAHLQQSIPRIGVAELRALGEAPQLLDVRSDDEWRQGHLPGALHIDRGFLEVRAESRLPDRERAIVVYCESGTRSLFAAQTLLTLGYTRVHSLDGGLQAWKQAGHAVELPRTLDAAERRRYQRHLAIPEVGEAGQLRLLQARVLLIGAGGLGSPAALYLAAAGVGTLGLVDDDVVDESNLQRQVLHANDWVGRPKLDSAQARLAALNPGIRLRLHPLRLSSDNAGALFADYDLVVDGSDNFATRYVINDTCVAMGLPFVHGSVYRFEGQVSVFGAQGGPCYRCLYPEPPPPELAPSCAEAGVLGVLPGTIGLLQATEVIKLILGVGQPLVGHALRYDALAARFSRLAFRRDPDCPCCGAKRADALAMPAAASCALA